jgi:putative ABC transport system permease protein
VAVSRSVADAHSWTVGSTAELWLGDGALVRLRVVATLHDRFGLPTVLLPWQLASAHSARPVPDAIYIGVGPGTESTALRENVGVLGGTVVPTSAYLSTVDAEFDRLARLALLAIVGMAVLYTAISIANTQLMAVAARAGELATLRLAGATPGQIRRIVVCEAALASTAGGLLAAAVTAATLAVIAVGLAPVASGVHIVVPWPTLAATAAACIAIATLASLAPTYRRP